MWERLTEGARRVFFFAQEEAAVLGEHSIGTEYLLFGLMVLGNSDSQWPAILRRLGISLERVRREIEQVKQAAGKGLQDTKESVSLTADAERAISLAADEADQAKNSTIDRQHLFLGILREENGLGGTILRHLGVDVERARQAIAALFTPPKMQPRPMALADRGMVATAHPLAAAVGLEVLMQGGNAMDAAIAVAAVLNVVRPWSCGIGGDAFILYYDARTRNVTGINGSGGVPYAATVEYYRKKGWLFLPEEGIHSVTVPGAVDAYATALKHFGSMPLAVLLQPAIHYAEKGYPLNAADRREFALTDKLRRFPSSAKIFGADGEPSGRAGRLVNRDLAKSLRQIAEGGRDAFYHGEIAKAIVRCSDAEGGLFTMKEFAGHHSMMYDAISADYRGYTVHETAPPSQGHIVLEELNIIEGFDVSGMGFGTAECIHHMVEAKKLAFADRLRYSGDPALVDVPLGVMLSKEFAAQRRRSIDPNRADPHPVAGDIHRRGDTTSFVVVDKDRNAVSFIISLSGPFGSGLIPDGTGILLNNRAGLPQGFTLEEGHPNCLAPGKRPMHTLNTYLITKGGALFAVGNTLGGDDQPQWNFQVIVNVVDFGMDSQGAADAPRWSSFPGTNPNSVGQPFVLNMEERFSERTMAALEKKGHTLRRNGAGGEVQFIQVDPATGALMGGSDARAGGMALGY